MKLGIVLLNYNTWQDTLECVKSIQSAVVPKDMEIDLVVVDNASKDDSIKQIKAALPSQNLIESPINTGFAGGNNLGIKSILTNNPTHILLLNNDTLIPQNFFERLDKCVINRENVGIVSPKIYFAEGFEFHKDAYLDTEKGKVIWYAGGHMDWNNVLGSHLGVDEVDNGQFTSSHPTDFATGCAMLIKKEVIDTIGLLNEDYFLYLEDLEYCQRAKRAGFEIWFDPDPFLWHKVSKSAGGSGSDLNDYFITRNRLFFGFTYASLRTRFALLRQSLQQLYTGTSAQQLAVNDWIMGKKGKGNFLK